MADRYRRPCFDSSVFLGGLNGEIVGGIKREVIFRYLWEKAREREFPVLISALTIAETFKKRNRPASEGAVLDEFLECINQPFVEVIEVDRETSLQAHVLCRTYASNGLMPNDAIHLACAIRAKCDVLLTWDDPLTSVRHEGIRIEEPEIYDRVLFTESEHATEDEVRAYEESRREQEAEPVTRALPGSSGGHTESQTGTEETTPEPSEN